MEYGFNEVRRRLLMGRVVTMKEPEESRQQLQHTGYVDKDNFGIDGPNTLLTKNGFDNELLWTRGLVSM